MHRVKDIGLALLIFPGFLVVCALAYLVKSDWVLFGAGAYFGWLATYAWHRAHQVKLA